MKRLALPIRWKVPLAVIGLSLLIEIVTQTLSYVAVRNIAVNAAQLDMTASARRRVEGLDGWLEDLRSGAKAAAANPSVAKALRELAATLADLGADPLASLRDIYITRNPNPPGERSALEMPEAKGMYHFRHGKLHPYLRTLAAESELYDIFLVSPQGDVLYTVAKEDDFGTNLIDGPYAGTELGQVVRAAMALPRGQTALSDFTPYAPSAGAPAMFVAAPVYDDFDQLAGVVAMQVSTVPMQRILAQDEGLGASGEAFILGSDGRSRSPSRQEGLFQAYAELPLAAGLIAEDRAGALIADAPTVDGGSGIVLALPIAGSDSGWHLVMERTDADIHHAVDSFRNRALTTGLVLVALITGAGLLLARSITRPVARLSAALSRVGAGDLDTPVPDTARADEMGEMASTLEGLRHKLALARGAEAEQQRMRADQDSVVERLSGALQALSAGDLTAVISTQFPNELEALRGDFNSALTQMSGALAGVVQSSSRIGGAAAALGQSAAELSRRTETQAATLEQAVAALDQMTGSVRATAEAARNVERITKDAKGEAEQSGEVVRNAVRAMHEIEGSSGQINQIIGVIDDIAFQTNLLALNAGVEAARAGEAGKGFAVVASEVRALAQRSSQAAKEIKALIATSAQQVESGVAQVGLTGETLGRIVTRVQDIARLVTEIAAAASEQATGLNEINTGMTQLDGVTQQNAAMVGQSEDACRAMEAEASALHGLVARFRTDSRTPVHSAAAAVPPAGVPTEPGAAEPRPATPAPAFAPAPRRAVAGDSGGWEDF